jgi:hypothetical protein
MTASPRALRAISRPNVPGSEVRHTLQSARVDEWRSGPVGTVRAGHHDRCVGRSQQGSEEGASRVRVTRKAAQSQSAQCGTGTLVTTTAALGVANKALRKALPAPGVSQRIGSQLDL